MRTIILSAVLVSLVGGLAGAFAYGQLFGEASAAPALQSREDQITIFAAPGPGLADCELAPGVYGAITSCPPQPGAEQAAAIEIDATDYPRNTTFRLDVAVLVTKQDLGEPPRTYCVRLFDITANLPVGGGEICRTNATSQVEILRVRTDPFLLTAEPHEYVIDAKDDALNSSGTVGSVRIIAEWTERAR